MESTRTRAATCAGCATLLQGWVEEGDPGFDEGDEGQVDDLEDEQFLEEAGKRLSVLLVLFS